MEKVRSFVRKAKVVATSVVAKLTMVGTFLTAAAAFAAEHADVPLVGDVLPWITVAVGIVTTVTRIVRVVAEVPDDVVGLEPVTPIELAAAYARKAEADGNFDDFWRSG